MDFLKKWRLTGWINIDGDVNRETYSKFGGSLISHPNVINIISGLTGLSVDYYANISNDQVMGAIATLGKYIAGDKGALEPIFSIVLR